MESIKTAGKADTWPTHSEEVKAQPALQSGTDAEWLAEHDVLVGDAMNAAYHRVGIGEARSALMVHAAQRPADSWRDAVQDELTTLHLSCPDDPRQAIKDMIEWNVRIALDPTVSSDAQALIERGRQEAQRPAAPAPQDDRAAGFGSCDVCGKGLRYGERHTTCGAAVENAVKAALASRPVPPPIRDDEAEDLIDAANRKFNAYRSSIRGQQLTVLDDWKHWLIREVIAARDAQWKGGM